MISKTLEELESESSAVLARELLEPRKLLNTTGNLLGRSAMALQKEDFNKRNAATRVAVILIIRLANDSRCVSLMAKMGYGMQAASLACSIYEIAYTVAYIGADDSLAEKWINHDEVLKTPFGSILKLTEGGLLKLGVPSPEKHALSEYRNYTQLCMAKHGNPLIQGQHGLHVSKESVIPKNGPDHSEKSIRVGWFTLEKSASAMLVASQSFVSNQVPESARTPLQAEHNATEKKCRDLRELAVNRWGSEDPSPGKWKA